MELCFLIVMALATEHDGPPVVGALLMFALMIGPAAAARLMFTRRPGHAIALAIGIALANGWESASPRRGPRTGRSAFCWDHCSRLSSAGQGWMGWFAAAGGRPGWRPHSARQS